LTARLNNAAERDIRMAKLKQKISGRLTSKEAIQDRLDISSYIDTARKHGCNVMDVLRGAITGNPGARPSQHPPEHNQR
jgi:transposase